MTERKGPHSDDQASPPASPANPPDDVANASGPLSLRPQGDKPESPSAEQNQWGGPPPAAGLNTFSGAPAPESGNAAPYQWPDKPGSRPGAPPDETTVVVDRSNVSDWIRGRGD